jgi:hypothetical protein
MFGNGRLAARSALAAGLLTALATLTAAPALAAPAAAAAPAARTAPAGTRAFGTWAAAQQAVGFPLYAPHRTAGLKFDGAIAVARCKATAKVRWDVTAEWGAPKTHLILDQNATSASCLGSLPPLPPLGIYRVNHVTYRLTGACGVAPLPSCASKTAVLLMTWKIGPRFYMILSEGVARGALLPFATSIKKV